ncbi:toxin-antitoxin system HicB family antitoxin [Calidithermus roseus]|uniref:Antitoxin VapB43 n=1 Tax=Calidithermus roseus TaxID=1644118 RepID=A0A399EQZ3_9DEIN|nr:toxin-antitoxin system HicB family antitoxin [Calidithermus roseus]RIH84972.1 Antitoxin VapB43 [Calidithermus roseus]
MQTTLRINDELYRKAKAEAARQGITLTQFLEEALRLRLQYRPGKPANLPTFDSGKAFDFTPEQLKQLIQASQAEHDLHKMG